MKTQEKITKGRCYCGEVAFEVTGKLRGVVNCHCNECTALNGIFGAHTKANKSQINITKNTGLKWFEISENARRGFCKSCGSSVFWEQIDDVGMGIIAGTLEKPTQLKTIGHIFVSEKSDFYEITDPCPQYAESSDGKLEGDHL